MICPNCGNSIDDNAVSCPACGTPVVLADSNSDYDARSASYSDGNSGESKLDANDGQDFFDENPVYPEPSPSGKAFPSVAGLSVIILSALAAVLSLICFISILSLRSTLSGKLDTLSEKTAALDRSIVAIDSRMNSLEGTLSTVQTEAYNQFASQSISIVKDITPLTGPVESGKYNRMFIISAEGSLNLATSFNWQKYNESTGGWVSIVFTGDATTNTQYGLRLENSLSADETTFTSILWANGITKEAAGTYRCVITDTSGITRTSAEATVSIQ